MALQLAENWFSIVVSAIVVMVSACRIAASLDSFWLDEIWSWSISLRVGSTLEILTKIQHDNNHFLNTAIIYLLGSKCHWFFYRAPAVVVGIGTVLLCALTARRWGRMESITTLLITGTSFLLIQYSSEARGYAYALFFAIAAWELLQRSFEKPHWVWDLLFACCTVLGFLAHTTYLYLYAGLACGSLRHLVRHKVSWRQYAGPTIGHFLFPVVMLAGLYFINLRHMKIGGGDEYSVTTVVTQALSIAFGGPLNGIVALLVALCTISAGVVALYLLFRSKSDLWLPFAGIIFVFPALMILIIRPTVLYPRYFLTSMLFLQLLLSYLLARLYHRARYGKLLYLLMMASILVGNTVWIKRFLVYGRGNYQAAIEFMLDRSPDFRTVASDHDFRNTMVLKYYIRRLKRPMTLVYLPERELVVGKGADWLLFHYQDQDFTPDKTFEDSVGNSYALQAVFPYVGLSGWHWLIYENINSGTRADSGSAQQGLRPHAL